MEPSQTSPDLYPHVRILISMIVSLAIAQLLKGLAAFVQHPKLRHVSFLHLGWVFSVLLSVIHFWWWEFRLSSIQHWSFGIYFFIISYAILFFLLSTLLFPDSMEEYSGFQDYFLSKRKWFFGLLALTFIFDVIDTALKGSIYLHSFGIEYPVRIAVYIVLCIVAMFVANRRFQLAFVSASLLYQLSWILRLYGTQ
jgi:hypothetical protein